LASRLRTARSRLAMVLTAVRFKAEHALRRAVT